MRSDRLTDAPKAPASKPAADPLLPVARLLKAGDYEGAAQALSVRIGTRAPEALNDGEVAMAARIEHRRRRWEASLPFWREIVRRDPANTEALFRGGQALLETGEFETAADLLSRAEAGGASFVDAVMLQARALEELGRLDAALDAWMRLLGHEDPRAHVAAARAIPLARRLGRMHQVIALTQAALDAGHDLAGVEADVVEALLVRSNPSQPLVWPERSASVTEDVRSLWLATDAVVAGVSPPAGEGFPAERERLRAAIFVHSAVGGAGGAMDAVASALSRFATGEVSLLDMGAVLQARLPSSGEDDGLLETFAAARIAGFERGAVTLGDLRRAGYGALALRLSTSLSARGGGDVAYAAERAAGLRATARYEEAARLHLALADKVADPWPQLVAAIDALLAIGRTEGVPALLRRLDDVEAPVAARRRQRLLLHARSFAAARQHPQAIAALQTLLLEDVRSVEAYVRLNAAYIALSDYGRALDVVRLAESVEVKSLSLQLGAATAHRALGDAAAAATVYEQALEFSVGLDDRLLPILADFLWQADDPALFETFLAKSSRWAGPTALLYRATLLYEFGALDRAETELRAEPVLVADSDRLAAMLSRVLTATNRYEAALQSLAGFPLRTLSSDAARAALAPLLHLGRFDEARVLLAAHPAAFAGEFGRLQTLHSRLELELAEPAGPWWTTYRDFTFIRALQIDAVGGRYVAADALAELPNNRSLFVCAVQGVGDEIRNASLYADVLQRFDRVTVTCDPRLELLLSRAFPKAAFVPYARRDRGPATPETAGVAAGLPDRELDRILDAGAYAAAATHDAVTTVSDALAAFRPNAPAFHHRSPYLVPDPQRRDWAAERLGPGGLKVGVVWRSGHQRPIRNVHYTQLDDWGPVFALPGARFFNLLYGDVEEELSGAEARFGVRIDRLDDVDLRDDFEGVAALLASFDVVIGPCVATTELAGALGTPVLMLWRTRSAGWRVTPQGRDLWYDNMIPVFGDPVSDAASLLARAAQFAESFRPASHATASS